MRDTDSGAAVAWTGRALAVALVGSVVAVLAGTALHLRDMHVPLTMELPDGEPLTPGTAAPDFRLATVDGDSLSLGDLRGKVVLIDVWATWCGPCRVELPVLQRLYKQELAGGDVEIVAVSVDADPRVVPDFARRLGLTFPVVADGAAVQARYRVTALPTLFVVDVEGIVRHVHVGYVPGSEVNLVEQVEALRRRPSSAGGAG